ncbi:NAD(P)H:quinone oxidoreductase [Micromonospora parathelypteridis]|uniref:NAD(P)H dehydrogenase (Quinone) n=1 Tax=Micromonospora parathelypteridis TaxID=1839617 RepID=A0A840VQ60_9ACTN|nr:NAD(P)H:quinone oxidoreductase [Micromonospora parathelypteridis]MBB5476154.1 NAD(P)H dehydrogenase (quinone) [Micromonospora parathelypteridis]GGO13644.1 NAD(P)H:quinone oxidoreductase type IV [Micromonospora parathelypteridis]
MTKLSVIYYSSTGTVHAMAKRLAEAGEKAGAEVRLRQVPELAPEEAIASNAAWSQHFDATKTEAKAAADDVVWADAVLFGTPTRYGNVSSQLKQFIDTLGPQWGQGLLADKVYAGFTASMTAHGGQESTLLALYNTIHHFGGLVVAPGYTDPLKFGDGNPYGVSHVTGGSNDAPLGDAQLNALDHMAQRVVKIAGKLTA